MNYLERLENVAVLGAAGKMGSGILLLTAQEMATLSLQPENKSRQFVLHAVDVSQRALSDVMKFLKTQVQKAAEKNIVRLRGVYADRDDLIENSEIIDQYVFDTLNLVRPTTKLEAAYDANLVFEAVNEKIELKTKLFSQINTNNKNAPWFLTNTSSIPIAELDKQAQLGGRIIGCHFYNPPAVQKLVEVIKGATTLSELAEFTNTYAGNLRKKVVPSNDVAGFIGNGHFMRDLLHGIAEAERLAQDMPLIEAIYLVNKVSQDFLIRPMGIFQLIDYVGLDVCQFILQVMRKYLQADELQSSLLENLIGQGVLGGQFADGSQKDGFFHYEKGRPATAYNPEQKTYVPIAEFQAACDEKLGALPASALPWKTVIGKTDKDALLKAYFKELNGMNTLGAELAKKYGHRSKAIGRQLVADGVAQNENDVNTVLLTGFYHAYGPINEYFA